MDLLTIVILLALGATAVSLFLGIISMERGGQYDREHGTRYMAMRVAFPGTAGGFRMQGSTPSTIGAISRLNCSPG